MTYQLLPMTSHSSRRSRFSSSERDSIYAVMEKGIEFSLTKPDTLGRALSDAILGVDPPDGFKPFKGVDLAFFSP